jgi:hypothetical protein
MTDDTLKLVQNIFTAVGGLAGTILTMITVFEKIRDLKKKA